MKENDFSIVGIGASAGGMDPIKAFFSEIPKEVNAAFVVIQHLSRDFKSLTAEWLSKCTPLPIISVKSETAIERGKIYLLPEGKILRIIGDNLVPEDRPSENNVNLAIDIFFHNLGEEAREKAVGIILSGTGTDGSRGIKTIKSCGGTVFVQEPHSAIFDSMPSIAISAEDPDLILPPKALGAQLVRFIQNSADLLRARENGSPKEQEKQFIEDIIGHVSEYSNVNFRAYKINTILRRIEKRTKLNHLHSLEDYHTFLKSNPDEVHILYKDLLIGVTSFFRDDAAFEVLAEKIIPEIFKKESYETVRILVAGCCTGEEAYSIAILCEEYLEKNDLDIPYKIFATDLDPRSIEFAGIGRYNKSIEKDVSQQRLEQYFTRQDELYEIKKFLRKKIIFARHNIITDPAFIKLDLLSCRNLFIYFKPELQKKLLNNFSYAINPDGYLFLGATETTEYVKDLFSLVDGKWKIFQNHKGNKSYLPISSGVNKEKLVRNIDSETPIAKDSNTVAGKFTAFEEVLLEEYVPTCIFLDEKYEVVYTHGNISRYLKIPSKWMNYSVFNMVNESLYVLFKNALRKLKDNAFVVHYREVPLRFDDQKLVIDLSFKAMPDVKHREQYILIEFIERKEQSYAIEHQSVALNSDATLNLMDDLEMELKLTKKELQFSVDELEKLNEELQASNEEMHSSNEELHSANEEMQSTNEELQNLNSELHQKLNEIIALNSEINNLITNTKFAILFLDEQLNIKHFTPAAQSYFNIRDADVGRPITHLTHHFKYPTLQEDAEAVLSTGVYIEKEIESLKGNNFFKAKILPYETGEKTVKGIVLTFVNVTNLKKALLDLEESSRELKVSEQSWKSLANHTPDLISRYDKNLKIVSVNETMTDFHGTDAANVIGKTNDELGIPIDPATREAWIESIQNTFQTGEIMHAFYNFYKEGQERNFYSSFVPEYNEEGNVISHVLSICRDMTEIRKHELHIEQQNHELQRVNTDLDNFIYTASHDLKAPIANIEGLSQILTRKLMNKLDDAEIEIVDMINQSVKRFNKTIMELTEITKIQKNLEAEREKIVIRDTVEDVKLDLKNLIDESGVDIIEDFEIEEVEFIHHYLRSIVYNLLSNAIKYRAEDRPAVVKISTYSKDDFVIISVKDNGIGLTNAEKAKVFGMFKRLHTHVEGTGIGLYTLKRMLENNHGKIEVDSKKDEGSHFKVFIPQAFAS